MVDAVRHLDRDEVVQHDELAVTTGEDVRVADRVQPGGIERNRHRHDDVAGLHVRAVGTEFDDLAAEFVAHDDIEGRVHAHLGDRLRRRVLRQLLAQRLHRRTVLQHVEVGPADAARQRAHEDLTRAGNRVGDVTYVERPVAHGGGSHGLRRYWRATLPDMSVVKINAIEVPEGMGAELEKRFGARVGEVEKMPGFEGFELLRPTGGESRYFVYTRWASEEDFQGWVSSSAFTRGHAEAGAARAVRPSPTAPRCSSSKWSCGRELGLGADAHLLTDPLALREHRGDTTVAADPPGAAPVSDEARGEGGLRHAVPVVHHGVSLDDRVALPVICELESGERVHLVLRMCSAEAARREVSSSRSRTRAS